MYIETINHGSTVLGASIRGENLKILLQNSRFPKNMNGDSKSPARTSGQTKTSQTKYSTTKLKEQSSLTNSSLGHSRTSVNSSAKFSTTSKTGLESNTNIRSRVGVDQKKNEQFVIVRDANGQDATPISLAFTKSGRVDTLGNQEASTRVDIY